MVWRHQDKNMVVLQLQLPKVLLRTQQEWTQLGNKEKFSSVPLKKNQQPFQQFYIGQCIITPPSVRRYQFVLSVNLYVKPYYVERLAVMLSEWYKIPSRHTSSSTGFQDTQIDNDLADRAVSQATELPPSTDLLIAFSSALNVIKKVIRDPAVAYDQTREIYTQYRPSIDTVKITTREDEVLIARLCS